MPRSVAALAAPAAPAPGPAGLAYMGARTFNVPFFLAGFCSIALPMGFAEETAADWAAGCGRPVPGRGACHPGRGPPDGDPPAPGATAIGWHPAQDGSR